MSRDINIRHAIEEFVPRIESAKGIFGLFELLKYPKDTIFDPSYTRKIQEFEFKKEEEEKIEKIYTVLGYGQNLSVFLIECKSINSSFIRYVSNVFSTRYINVLLIFTQDYDELVFVLPDTKIEGGKQKLRLSRLTIEKNNLYYTDKEVLAGIALDGKEQSWRDVWLKWREAFSLEKVTENFFKDYQNVFFYIRKLIIKQNIPIKEAHEFTLQLLNRIMFIYFIAKKRWLGNNPKFFRWLWKQYLIARNNGKTEKDSFYDKWISVVFFEAFNNRPNNVRDLPTEVREVLINAPYLNGGLFTKNDKDELPVKLKDETFKKIFDELFEKYNFTIKEDIPIDVEVAVDPQMIGYVYESLANVAEESYEKEEDLRGRWGIFYTPRVEVDFMVRRSLVEYLVNHLPDVPKEKLYQFVFDEDTEQVEKYFDEHKLWNTLEETLDNLSVVDPACGSGAFLVGMLIVLSNLYKILYRHLRRSLSDFELKNRIIMRSLYGVDVMPWAIHAAELRLWLQLIVESKLSAEELRKHPLLPNLNMNLRIGDSLVQEIGGISFHLRDSNISEKMKKKLYELKLEKQKYFNNDPTAKFKNRDEIVGEETRLFSEIIRERLQLLASEKDEAAKIIQGAGVQQDLFGNTIKLTLDDVEIAKKRLSRIQEVVNTLEDVKNKLKDPQNKPFVWDIDFAEIFGDKGGFDIVIGNPPYVRQESIVPPEKTKNEVTVEDRKEYKEKLINSLKAHFPMLNHIDKKSDYYVYFYFHGLSLLNQKGVLCFITSNSWLDVGYGKDLQEFLLKYVPIIGIYDNQAKRSFEHADINTIIVIFGAPRVKESPLFELEWPCMPNVARFVMFKKPFEEVINSKNVLALDNADKIIRTSDYRIFPMNHEELLKEGWEYPDDFDYKKEEKFSRGRYAGNKWGGKYLRAPDIYFTIMEKGVDKLIRLDKTARLFGGIKSGANDYFYINEETIKKWKIEDRYIKPIFKSPRECKSIEIKKSDLMSQVFVCHEDKKKLNGTNALSYIKWGEKAKVVVKHGSVDGTIIIGYNNLQSVTNRKRWYDIGEEIIPDLVWAYLHNDALRVFKNSARCLINNVLYGVTLKNPDDLDFVVGFQNSSVTHLFIQLYGRVNYGEGAVGLALFEVASLPILDPSKVDLQTKNRLHGALQKILKREIRSVFLEYGFDPSKPVREQEPKPLPDRKELDEVIFDIIGLTEHERKEVYWSVCELVKARLDKAESLKKSKKVR